MVRDGGADSTLPHVDSVGASTRRVDLRSFARGDRIDRYEIRRLIGEGGMGEVYLARDLLLGRSVAIKRVHRSRFAPTEVARFLAEARLIASLNHPHIVQIYDVGEHQQVPFLALEYIDGESLREREARERMTEHEALRVLRAIAEALVHAHAAGVVHCDLKPSNVMIGRDGRLRVVDFGLALTTTTDRASVAGTPDWMAPEQWTGGPITDRADIWALAVIAAHLLGDELARSEHVADLVARSRDATPAARPSAATWARLLDDVIEGRDRAATEDTPFRGLAPFDESHARSYFGREAEIDAFVERLRDVPILPVAGPSGIGKSSFIFAGVVPRLRARERWTVIDLRPGATPFAALARAVLEAGSTNADDAGALARELFETPTLLAVRLATLASATRAHVLLAIDQLEELFTHDVSELAIARFLQAVLAAADDPREPIRVVYTLRDDFVGRVAGLGAWFVLRRMNATALRRVIADPVARAGYRFDEPTLVETMLHELGDAGPAELALVQFACAALWEDRDRDARVLRTATYRAIGGVAGALARHADGVLASLSTAEQRLAREILCRLVVGTTRRAIERGKLVESVALAAPVLDRLIRARLVVQRSVDQVAIIELAHESLVHTWSQLERWLDETREERRFRHDVEEAAEFWERRGRRDDEVWDVAELSAATHRISQLGIRVSPRASAFLAAAERRHRRRKRHARWRVAAIASLGLAITLGSVFVAIAYRRKQLAVERAGLNLGHFELRLVPFDWTDGPHEVPVDALPALRWGLYERDPSDEHVPGQPVATPLHVDPVSEHGHARIDRVSVRGGPAFLRIDGRGRPGEACAPSWIRLRALPNYSDREDDLAIIEIRVPTCAASRADTIAIPTGEFIYGGAGRPATHHPEYVEPEARVALPAFAIDRTEVSNARFAPFAQLAQVTGYPVPSYPSMRELPHAADPTAPVTSIDAFEAEAFCRYYGRHLPSDHEWTKAARGGLALADGPNPIPDRLFPWGDDRAQRCANIDGTDDGYDWVAPVDAFPCGASPYGVLNLAGNVSEWISREGQTDRSVPQREVRGGDVESPAELEHATTIFRNAREGRWFSFSIGVRCVGDGTKEEDRWQGH